MFFSYFILFCCKISLLCDMRCFVAKSVLMLRKLSQKMWLWRKKDIHEVCSKVPQINPKLPQIARKVPQVTSKVSKLPIMANWAKLPKWKWFFISAAFTGSICLTFLLIWLIQSIISSFPLFKSFHVAMCGQLYSQCHGDGLVSHWIWFS